MSALQKFLEDVVAEVSKAEQKWPTGTPLLRLAALQGEAGELAQDYIKQVDPQHVYSEAVQVAAMAYRFTVALEEQCPLGGG